MTVLAPVDVPLGPLGDTAFTFREVPTTGGEVAAFVTDTLCVWLAAKEHVASCPLTGCTSRLLEGPLDLRVADPIQEVVTS